MTLKDAQQNHTYIVEEVTGNEKVRDFLFTLGCYEDCEITVITRLSGNFIVNIKDGRYAIDESIASNVVLYD